MVNINIDTGLDLLKILLPQDEAPQHFRRLVFPERELPVDK